MSACKHSSECLNYIITDVIINGLATKLRKQCYDNGVEKDPKESAKTLHRLGLAYKEKSPDKISLIQSVALMTSAVLRQPDNADDIRKDLDDVCMYIMTLANAANPDAELVSKAVAETKAQVQILRQNTKDKLAELKPMSDDLKGEQLNANERKRVSKMREIQNFVSKTYTEIMTHIAEYTEQIIGKPPCKFALVGMGSLAKKEVTPYSDFESIIVLEEKYLTRPDYKYILEYFRWFAVVFQMILVRLGETLLTFLAIPCLNNTLNKKEDWFYDAHTPCGISPDGFAPQASKNPLGRQTKTQKKTWTTELIKPVSEMVKYLETEEDLKNGYHLADMLNTTCFVYGDSVVCKEFETKIKQKLNAMAIFNQRAQQNIKEDFDLYQPNPWDLLGKVDIKRVALRSCSYFVLALGRLYKCKNFTCFDILDELLDRDIMDETLHGKLQLSLAVACEMRLRWYSRTSGQNDIVHHPFPLYRTGTKHLTKDIGDRAVIVGINIIASLQHYVLDCFENERIEETIDIVESRFLPAWLAFILQVFTLALELIDECKTSDEELDEEEQHILQIMRATCLFQSAKYEEMVKICDDELTRLSGPRLIAMRVRVLLIYCGALNKLKKYQQELKYIEMLSDFDSVRISGEIKTEINMTVGHYYMVHGDYAKARHYTELAYNEIKKDPLKLKWISFAVSIGFNVCLNCVGCYDKAISVNKELISERRKEHVDEGTDTVLNSAFYHRCVSLYELKRYTETLVYCNKALKCINLEIIDCLIKFKINSLEKMGRLAEAQMACKEIWFELLVQEKATKQTVTDFPELDEFFHIVSTHLVKDRNFHYAVRFDKMSFQCSIFLKSFEYSKMSVIAACSLVTNLFKLRRYEECLAAAKHGIKLCQFVYENCCVEEKFVEIVIKLAACEWELKVRPSTPPYETTPSIFYNVGSILHKWFTDISLTHNFPFCSYVFQNVPDTRCSKKRSIPESCKSNHCK